MLTREQRIKDAEDRVRENRERSEKSRGEPRGIFDFEVIGGYKEDIFIRPEKKSDYHAYDIIPFYVTAENYPYPKRIGKTDYVLDLFIHRFVGKDGKFHVVCPQKNFGQPCPICEEHEELKKIPGTPKAELAKLVPKQRCYYNVIDVDSKDQKIHIFEESYHLFEKNLLAAASMRGGGVVPFSDIEVGKSVEFYANWQTPRVDQATGQNLGNFFKYEGIKFIDRQPYDESIFKEVYPLDKMLRVLTYEQIRNIHYEIDAVEEDPRPETTSEPQRDIREERRPRRSPEPEAERAEEPASAQEDRPRRERIDRSERRREEAPKLSCPYDHAFGIDNMAHDECRQCAADIYEACEKKYNELNNG